MNQKKWCIRIHGVPRDSGNHQKRESIRHL